ncbi:hypothetical protein [Priestia koreensis]|uniref:hypothetical protein n=1 Tax=Priestia koreensis TaxID=284581 RepID=UPI00203AA91E|nr:hypothetical protein [Priestia koreensis]MCM3005845.1 hypothetical protein [Priestia koreensis]
MTVLLIGGALFAGLCVVQVDALFTEYKLFRKDVRIEELEAQLALTRSMVEADKGE